MNNIRDINKLIYAGENKSMIQSLLPKRTKQKLKIWMGNSTGNWYLKSTTTSINDKTGDAWTWGEKKKTTQVKQNK